MSGEKTCEKRKGERLDVLGRHFVTNFSSKTHLPQNHFKYRSNCLQRRGLPWLKVLVFMSPVLNRLNENVTLHFRAFHVSFQNNCQLRREHKGGFAMTKCRFILLLYLFCLFLVTFYNFSYDLFVQRMYDFWNSIILLQNCIFFWWMCWFVFCCF